MLLAFNQKNSSRSTVEVEELKAFITMETNNNNSNNEQTNPGSKKRKVEQQQQQQQPLLQPPGIGSSSNSSRSIFAQGGFAQNMASLPSHHYASQHADLILQQRLANERAMSTTSVPRHHSLPTISSSSTAASWQQPTSSSTTSTNNNMNHGQYRRFIESSMDLGTSFYRPSDIQSILSAATAGGGRGNTGLSSPSLGGLNGSFLLPMMGSQQQQQQQQHRRLTIPPSSAASIGLSDYRQALAVERLLQQQDRSNLLGGQNLSSILLDRAVPVQLLPLYQQHQQLLQQQQQQQHYQQSLTPVGAVSSSNIQLLHGRDMIGSSSQNHLTSAGVAAGSTLAPSQGGSNNGGGLKRSYPDTPKNNNNNDDDGGGGSDNIKDYGVTNIKIDGDLEEKLPIPDADKRVRILHYSQRKCVPLATDEDINWYVVDC